jgi:hypothetical protein
LALETKGVAKMKFFKQMGAAAVFLIGAYQAVSVVDGKVVVNLDGDALKFELRFPWSGKPASSEVNPAGQSPAPPYRVVVVPVPDAPSGETA